MDLTIQAKELLKYGHPGRPRRDQEVMQLLALKYDRNQICKMMHIKRASLRVYLSRLRRQLGVNKTINKNVNKNVNKTINKNVNKIPEKCPSCGGALQIKEGAVVCTKCGLIVDEELEAVHNLPFGQTFQPSNNLHLGRGLGKPLPTNNRELYRILALSPNGTQDLPIRARQIRTLMEYREHPIVASALKTAYNLAIKYGFKQDNDAGAMWLNGLGKIIRRVSSFLVYMGENARNVSFFTKAVFTYYVSKTVSEKKAEEIKEDLRVSNESLNLIHDLMTRYGWTRYLNRLPSNV